MANEYDVLVVGAGLAGLTAGMYAARYGLHTGVVEQMMGGAQIINLEKIENFPGFPEGISGAELGPATQEQAMNAGAEFVMAEAEKISLDGDYRVVSSDAERLACQGRHRCRGFHPPQAGHPRGGGVLRAGRFPLRHLRWPHVHGFNRRSGRRGGLGR